MRRGLRPDGTGNASPGRATEWVLTGGAAIETVLIAALALLVVGTPGDTGRGRLIEALERLNGLLRLPLDIVLPGTGELMRQGLAILLYGGGLLALAGTTSWVERRRALV